MYQPYLLTNDKQLLTRVFAKMQATAGTFIMKQVAVIFIMNIILIDETLKTVQTSINRENYSKW